MKKRTQKNFWNIFAVFIFVATLFLAFRDLPKVYFQQDEWHFFGWMLRTREGGILNMMKVAFSDTPRPLSKGLFQAFFAAFGLNEVGYNLASLFMHFVNSVLVYLIAFKLTKNRIIALISGALFVLNSAHLQATTWIGASVGSLFSGFFGLLSLYTFVNYLETSERRSYLQTLIFLILSMGFKESTLSLFLAYPLLAYILKGKKRSVVGIAKEYWLMLFVGVFWILQRLAPILFVDTTGPYLTAGSEEGSFLLTVITNIFLYPLQGISQVFVPPKAMFELTSSIMKIVKPILFNNDLFIQTIGSQTLSIILSLLIVGLSVFVYKHGLLSKMAKKALIFALIFTPIAFLPFILLPKSHSFLESRNYYLPSVGGALIFALIIWGIANFFKKKLRLKKQYFYFLLISLTIPFLLFQIGSVREEIKRLRGIGDVRKEILTQILNTYPEIQEKSVFYTESDEYPYGDAESLMRFQSGFGHVLLVLYAERGELSAQLLEEDYLWGIWDQGYKEVNGSGFGYFRDKEKISELIMEGVVQPENIYAFEWREHSLYDITQDVREYLHVQ